MKRGGLKSSGREGEVVKCLNKELSHSRSPHPIHTAPCLAGRKHRGYHLQRLNKKSSARRHQAKVGGSMDKLNLEITHLP